MNEQSQGQAGRQGDLVGHEAAPTARVLTMRQQGLSNNQIIQILQREGYEMDQIFNGMNQADIKQGVDFGGTSAPLDQVDHQQFQNPMQPDQMMSPIEPFYTHPDDEQIISPPQGQQVPSSFPPLDQNMGAVNPSPSNDQSMGFGAPMDPFSGDRQRIEELAEAIIDEKWNEIVRSINKIIDWKERMDTRITKMEQEFSDMQKNFDILQKSLLGKIGQYDENVSSVTTSLKAMEQVFQKLLPTMTENVNELSRISKVMGK